MSEARPNSLLHGITLKVIVEDLAQRRGWSDLASHIKIRCFSHDPSLKSSLHFLRRNDWARRRVEDLYLEDHWHPDGTPKRPPVQ